MAMLIVNAGGAGGGGTTNFSSLEEALSIAVDGDEIVLSNGAIQLEAAGSEDGQVFVDDNITITGAGSTATTLTATTSIAGATITSDAAIITVNAGKTAAFTGFTLDGGDDDGSTTPNGGVDTATGIRFLGDGSVDDMAIRNIGADVSLQPRGAGINIFNAGGNVEVRNSVFSGNERRDIGVFDGRNLIVSNSTFAAKLTDDDDSPNESVEYGIETDGAIVTVTNGTFTGYDATQAQFSSAAILAGGSGATPSSVTLTGGTFSQNSTAVVLGFGVADASSLIINSATVNSSLDGALAVAAQGNVTVTGAERAVGSALDVIFDGDNQANVFNSGGGADRLTGNGGSDRFSGGAGDDVIDGGDDADTAVFSGDRSGYTISLLAGGVVQVQDNNAADGDDGRDIIRNIETLEFRDGSAPVTRSGAADDTVTGTTGDDVISSGLGNDTVNSGAGNDTVAAGAGDDSVNSGGGDDTVDAGAGDDRVVTGVGNDTASGGSGDDLIVGEAGSDMLSGGTGNDTVEGGTDDDVVSGETGDDALFGGEGADTLVGGTGNDTAFGGIGNDIVAGQDGNDVIGGEDGDDVLAGETGDDTLFGGEGTDTLYGGAGSDVIAGQNGNDLLAGQSGDDVLVGEDGDDSLSGEDGNDSLSGEDGNDQLFGGAGSDALFGGAGNDSLAGQDGDDLVAGQDGDDVVRGEDGNDTVLGEAGNDILFGGAGNDVLAGGLGDDIFVFAMSGGMDRIADFEGVDDLIQISGFAGVNNFESAMALATDTNGGTLFAFNQADTLFLEGLAKSSFAADDFSFA